MDFIKECFEEHGRILMDELKTAGFSVNQAIYFLPEAASRIANSFQITGVEQTINNLKTENSCQLFSAENLESIMRESGLNSEKITSGFKVITPFFYYHFKKIN